MNLDEETSSKLLFLEETPELGNELRKKLEQGIYCISQKRGQSKVWEFFGKIQSEDGREIANYVACRKCLKICKFNTLSTSNLVKHKCYATFRKETPPVVTNVDAVMKVNLEQSIIQWSIGDCRTFDIVTDSGLHKLIEFFLAAGAKYGSNININEFLPQPLEVSENLEKLYNDYLPKFKEEINSIRNSGYGLTIDVWSDRYLHSTFLFITIHYIKNGELVKRYLGMESIERENSTSKEIKQAALEVLAEYNCTLDGETIILTSNNERMVEAFSVNNRIYCVNHLLDSTIANAIEKTPEIQELCEVSQKLYSLLNEVSPVYEEINENDITGRWNTIYYMISLLVKKWSEVVETCKSHEDGLKLLKRVNLSQISALANVLEPFEGSFKDLNDEKSITLHLVIVHMHRLRKLCVKNADDLNIIKKFKVNLLESFDICTIQNLTLQHKIALYLFPPTNKMISFSESDKDAVRTECRRLMKTFADKNTLEVTPDVAYSTIQIDDKDALTEYLIDFGEAATTSTKAKKNSELFSDFIESTENVSGTEEILTNEMRIYEDTNVSLQNNFNPLEWWHMQREKLPLLYKVSCKLLAVPATTMAAERVIKKARALTFMNYGSSNSASDLVNEILFLHFNVF